MPDNLSAIKKYKIQEAKALIRMSGIRSAGSRRKAERITLC